MDSDIERDEYDEDDVNETFEFHHVSKYRLQHPWRHLFDERYGETIDNAFQRCESPVEGSLLHCLLKGYHFEDIHQQFKVGKFRVDFVTSDGVGWELDGKKFHNEASDRARDSWILQNSDLRQIVRIQAAALMFYRDACLAVISRFVDHMENASVYCDRDRQRAIEEADSWLEAIHEYGVGEMQTTFQMGEAFDIVGNVGYVGSPFAFLPDDHGLREYLDEKQAGINRWRGLITSQVR